MEWAAFEKIEGPILIHERVDMAGALVAYITAISHGATKLRFKDFLPDWDRKPISEEAAAAALGMVLQAAVSGRPPHSG